jgi:hypothetical protein
VRVADDTMTANSGPADAGPDLAGAPPDALLAPSAASSASGTGAGNIDGEAVAITVFSTVKWWGRIELPLFFLFIRLRSSSLGDLKKLSFIHAARWSLVRWLPGNGGQPPRKLRHAHLYFESNFNGGWEEYIDAFSYVLTRGMWAFWGSSYGFPNALPPSPFKDYIRRNEYEANHFYSAYPATTTTTIVAALELAPRLDALRQKAPDMSAEEFAHAWRGLLSGSQSCL